MIIVMKPSATPDDMSRIIGILEAHDLIPHVSAGTARTIIGVVGDKSRLDIDALSVQPGVHVCARRRRHRCVGL